MNKAIVIAIALLTFVGGFFVGKSQRDHGGRAEGREAGARERRERSRMVELEPDLFADLQQRVARAEAVEEENRRLATRLREFAPDPVHEGELPVGSRRPDGTIVGGAKWSKMTTTLALGFLSGKVSEFFAEANLTESQQRRLRAELEKRVDEVMQNAADFVNTDITADQAYDSLDGIAADSRKMLAGVLDDKQLAIYREFEKGMVGLVHKNVVNNEMTALRKGLRLDSEQEKQVRAVVEERYRRVQDRLNAPIPNMFFRPMRRERDRDIYEQTGARIGEYLRPEQAASFALAEENANDALYEYRSLLIPNSR